MFTKMEKIIKFHSNYIVFLLLLFSSSALLAQDVYLCVWRNPERTMTKIFPEARDYRSMSVKITPDKLQTIERETGFPLLPGQRDKFQYFTMTGEGGVPVGTIIAASQKGAFGAIEFVTGVDTAGIIKGLYIQRSRERDQKYKDRAFLDLFVGKRFDDVKGIRTINTGESTVGTAAVINGLIKEFVSYNVTVKK